MNLTMKINFFYYFSFFIFFFIAIFLGRIAGAPPAYIAMYGLSTLLIYNNFNDYKISIPQIVKTLLIFFMIYFVYSFILTTHHISTVKYLIMWLLNISVVYFILKVRNLERFLTFFLCFMTLSSIVGLLLHFSGVFYSANPFDAFNKNSYIFLVMLAIAIAFYQNKKYQVVIILLASFFIYSRTLYLMITMSILFYILSRFTLKTFIKLLLTFIFLGIIVLNTADNNFVIERIKGAFTLIERLIDFFKYSDLDLGKGLGDHQRFYVIISNLDMLINVFPIGTGMGLDNYLSNIDPKYSAYLVGGDFHRAHNYYISYLAEMGFFFFFFTYILYKPLFLNSNIYFKSLYFGMLIGIATNEYITSPYFWILFALIYKNYYKERN